MAASLEKISDDEMRPGDGRKRWRTIKKLVVLFNALLNFQIILNSGRNAFTITESNATLELNIPAAADSAAVTFPWQPYLSPTATGPDAGRTIRIRAGCVSDGAQDIPPARLNLEIVVPPNCIDGYFVWIEANVDAGGRMTNLDYNHGVRPAGPVALGTNNAPPPVARALLFIITSTQTAVELSSVQQFRTTPLALVPVVTNQTSTQTERRMIFLPDLPGATF